MSKCSRVACQCDPGVVLQSSGAMVVDLEGLCQITIDLWGSEVDDDRS